jgi:hypothetical protein
LKFIKRIKDLNCIFLLRIIDAVSSEEITAEPKKSLTDEYFDRALEEAEKQVNAVEEPNEN